MKIRSLLTILTLAALLAACAPKDSTDPVTSLAPEITEVMGTAESTSAPTEVAQATVAPIPIGELFDVEISGFEFVQNTVTIKVGETVTWTNQDSSSHTIVADDGSFKSNSLKNGASFSHTFDNAGSFSYHCGIHASMTGTVIVEP